MMLILVTSMKMQSRLMSAVSLIDLILSFNSKDYNGDHPEALGNLIQDSQDRLECPDWTASVRNPSSRHPWIWTWSQSRSLKENHSECLFSWPGDSSPGFENEVVEEVIFRSTDIRYRNTTAKQKMKTELSKKKDGKMPSDLLDGRAGCVENQTDPSGIIPTVLPKIPAAIYH